MLAEAACLLRAHARLPSEKILALFERKVITVPFTLEAHAGPVAHLLEKYHDQGMQLADACLVRMSELERGQTADWNSSWAHGSRAFAALRWSWL